MPTSPRNYWTSFSSRVTTSSFGKEPMKVREPESAPGRKVKAPVSGQGPWARFPIGDEGWVLLVGTNGKT